MPCARAALTFSACLILPFSASAQQAAQPQPAQPPQPKDPQALAVLAQMAAVTGWSATNVPTDATAKGSVTVNGSSGAQSYQLVIEARPGNQVRTEFPTRGITLVVNGLQGERITPSGTEHLASYATLSMTPSVFPFLGPLIEWSAAETSVRYIGTGSVDSEPIYRIQLLRSSANGDGLDSVRERAAGMTLSVSANTYLPLKMEFERIATSNHSAVFPVTYAWTDFRRVGSVLVPFRLEESTAGQRLATIQLDSVQLNTGLADAVFSVQ